ncbi:hypothetical protein HZB90_01480 [archaeon]|nr:hypothetical protein [archaeon]
MILAMSVGIPKQVRKDLVKVLKRAQRCINNKDSNKLKRISEFTIDIAGVFQDQDSLSLAVVMYAISKLLERWGYESEYADEARNLLGSAEFSLEEGKFDEYRDKIKKVFEFTSSVDKEFRIYIDHVLEKARIKKGSMLYEHGISAARAAELLGIGQWELLSYIGKTRIHDAVEITPDVEQRLKFARTLFD